MKPFCFNKSQCHLQSLHQSRSEYFTPKHGTTIHPPNPANRIHPLTKTISSPSFSLFHIYPAWTSIKKHRTMSKAWRWRPHSQRHRPSWRSLLRQRCTAPPTKCRPRWALPPKRPWPGPNRSKCLPRWPLRCQSDASHAEISSSAASSSLTAIGPAIRGPPDGSTTSAIARRTSWPTCSA